MYFQEIKPGVFLSNEQTLHHKLDRCRHCGETDTMSHTKYSDKCIACGNAYNLYHVRRTARRKGRLTNKSAKAHLQLLLDVRMRQECGFEGFPGLDEELRETQIIVDNILALERREAELASYAMLPCICCGDEVPVRLGNSKPVKCQSCVDTYTRYTDLRKRATRLSGYEQDELASILTYYATQQRHGYRVPNFGSTAKWLQQHRAAEGQPKYKIYGGNNK